MKKFLLWATLAVAVVFSFSAANAENVTLPVGDIEKINAVVVPLEDIDDGIKHDNSFLLSEEKNDYEFYNYGSDYGYNDMLLRSNSKARQELYDDILKICQKFSMSDEDVINLTGNYVISELNIPMQHCLTPDEVCEVYVAFVYDHPEYYWLDNNISLGIFNNYIVRLRIYVDKAYKDGDVRENTSKEIDNNVKSYIEAVNNSGKTTAYEKAKVVRDLICDEVDYAYDQSGNPMSTKYAHSIVGVLDGDDETNVVCEGYAKTFALILNALDIDNIYITGLGDGGTGYGGHAWNMAKMDDGSYYYFDITWDDVRENEYFAKGEYDFSKDHIDGKTSGNGMNFLYSLPAVPDTDYNSENAGTEKMYIKNNVIDKGGKKGIEINLNKQSEQGIVYVACYNEGILKEIKSIPADSLSYFCELNYSNYSDIKVFLWDKAKSTPLADVSNVL